MRRTVFAAAVILMLAVPGLLAQDKEFSETVPFQPGQTLSLDTFKGSIHVSPWERSELSVFARITPPDDEDADYAQRAVRATNVEVRPRGSGVSIRSDYDDVPAKGSWYSESKNLPFVHYEIRVPRETDLRVDDHKSDIEVYELSGRLEIQTHKGTVLASGLEGDLRLETHKGKAELKALRGRLDIETHKGDVVAEALEISGDSRLNTHKGQIELSIPANQGLHVVGDTGRGSFVSDFQTQSRSARESGKLDAAVNQGGPRLKITTHKGDIRLKQL